ncbi:citrate/2-methylcitrate synthase [Butyricicoccus faecihominis]|uniref:citrate/2-methylcitrate synthase n=1 Tax=Butyricicoccaceae TaxID=3085642 RepID=UPI00247AA9F3|nr:MULTISPECIES: citrate/2-methylcitrate synthase [Butyricicoccaceae]MCQ5128062.1 citrate/2-methylcitrate synthase [Butyricicoccus faecihominis]WNX86369.1 citrate/2-methylcitrate synthase [Agathobaculum sp. NTUH-O15-33]
MTAGHDVLEVTPRVEALAALCKSNSTIAPALYKEFDVKRGLRDLNGEGVLAGLTNISDIISKKMVDGKLVPCDGELYYRGININDLVQGFMKDGRKGYEETAYLLLFGELPDVRRLSDFKSLLAQGRTLPTNFTRDVVMKAPTHDMMNSLSRSVLTLASYDSTADDISLPNVLRQCLMLISVFPMLAVYSYHAYNHYECGGSMYIHYPSDSLSTASNFLRMLRPDMSYSPLESKVLDLALVLHMEHGGGNNSSFTTHVVSSSGTDTYSAISAALGSLKGPKHGGANFKVVQMFEDLKRNVTDTTDEEAVAGYLRALLRREAFDKKGLIYGMGHAVYSISDPRARVFKSFVGQLAKEKGRDQDFALYSLVERLAPEVIAQERHIYKGVSANVDFYSGFVYSMLALPPELYTPVFAIARIVGWSAHRLEELINADKIIRPAYRCVQQPAHYMDLSTR